MKKHGFAILCVILLITATICGTVPMRYTYADQQEINCKAYLLMEANSGEIVSESKIQNKLPVASIVKLMTILITLENIESKNLKLDEYITTTENASSMGGSQVFMDPFVEYKCEDLLKSVIVASANDASVALAERISGSEDAFVLEMNKHAKALGMDNTNYVNCTGLPAPEQYSCALDCAILLKEVIKYDVYHKFSGIWMDELVHPSGRKTELVNTNKMIKYYKGCDSGKTGSTNEAGCCLVASAKRGDLRFISVVIGADNSKNRFKSTTDLFNFGFNNFENKIIVDKSIPLQQVDVNLSKTKTINVFAKENFYAFGKKGNNSDYKIEIQVNKNLVAPIKAGEKLGELKVVKNGEIICEIDVVSDQDINRLTYKDTISKIINEW